MRLTVGALRRPGDDLMMSHLGCTRVNPPDLPIMRTLAKDCCFMSPRFARSRFLLYRRHCPSSGVGHV